MNRPMSEFAGLLLGRASVDDLFKPRSASAQMNGSNAVTIRQNLKGFISDLAEVIFANLLIYTELIAHRLLARPLAICGTFYEKFIPSKTTKLKFRCLSNIVLFGLPYVSPPFN